MGIVNILKAIIKPIFSVWLGLMLLVLGVLWTAWIVSYISITPFISYFGPSHFLLSMIGGLAIFCSVAIPILGLMLLITRYFSSYRIPKRWRTNLWLGWGASLLIGLFAMISTASSFSHRANVSHLSSFEMQDVLTIAELPNEAYASIGWITMPKMKFTKSGILSENVYFDIVKSDDDKITVETQVSARGKSLDDAQKRTVSIDAKPVLNGDKLQLPGQFLIKNGNKFRDQRIHYIVHVPEGMDINFDPSIADLIWNSISFRDRVRPNNLDEFTWTMTDAGLASVGWDREYKAERLLDVKSAENINIDGRISTVISKGTSTEVLLKGPKAELQKVELVETDETTSLIVNGWLSDRVTLEITSPTLSTLHAKGLRSLRIEGFKQPQMELNFSGERLNSDIKVYVDVEELTCNLGGYNNITLLGSGNDLLINVLDGAKVVAEQYKVGTVRVKGNIYSNSTFYASDALWCSPDETSSITLYGEGKIMEDDTLY